MSVSSVYRPHDESPSTTELHPVEADGVWSDLSAHRFEVVSRGDFVPGLLYLPTSRPTPVNDLPLVIVQHGLAGSKTAPYLEFSARWVREGFAVAMIDLPLHGERSSPKLSARLVEGIERVMQGEELDADTGALVEEFARQSTSDLVRTLDALAALDAIDSARIGFVGFSLGAVVGSYFLAHDPRPLAAAFALAGGRRGPTALDPAEYISRISPRPVLVIAAESDERISADSSKALFDAAREPKEFSVSKGDHGNLSGSALGKIQSFLANAFAR